LNDRADVVIVGSGFGGSVMACRLAETYKFRVCVLERGRRYLRNGFPRRPDELRDAFWDPRAGLFGMFEYRSFAETDMDVWTASGLGGGSLIYANVLYDAPAEFFEGWPGRIERSILDPYYERVWEMMEARSYPIEDPNYAETPKTRALARAYDRLSSHPLGRPAARFERPRLAIQFGSPGEKPNRQGVMQNNCVRCGECDIGCNYHAKNTLDLNYLARAEQHGAEIRTNAEVRAICPNSGGDGFAVYYFDPRVRGKLFRLDARFVIVAAGSLGSTKLLLRMKHSGQLPKLSDALGTQWSGNGDMLGFALQCDEPICPSTGPVITAAVRFFHARYPDGFPHGLFIEDAGIPNILAWYITAMTPTLDALAGAGEGAWNYLKGFVTPKRKVNMAEDFGPLLVHESDFVNRTLPYLGMGRDRSTGVIELDLGPSQSLDWSAECEVRLNWSLGPSKLHFDRLRDAMQRLTAELSGTFVVNPLADLNKYISVHPLGGCPMGDKSDEGVVDARTGEVFGHPGLYVMDGSIIPTSIGPNPSLTIAAIAEMFAERFPGSEV